VKEISHQLRYQVVSTFRPAVFDRDTPAFNVAGFGDVGCERLMSVPGIGPIISSAMVAAIGTGDAFTKGRDFAAWLGLVPKQISTGDRTILGKISKRGNRYLRVLFVQAWVVLIKPNSSQRHGLKPWLEAAKKRCITTSSPSRSPTSSPALLGASLRMVEPTMGRTLYAPNLTAVSVRSPIQSNKRPHQMIIAGAFSTANRFTVRREMP
jgi:Transposase IS116/IS110/IS902 family